MYYPLFKNVEYSNNNPSMVFILPKFGITVEMEEQGDCKSSLMIIALVLF